MGCLRIVIVAIIVTPIAFIVLLSVLFPDFMGQPKPPLHIALAVILNHELSGNRHLVQPRYTGFPAEWCDSDGVADLRQLNPNTCTFVMFPSKRVPFFCPRRSGSECFEVYIPEEFWRRDDTKRIVVGATADLCAIVARLDDARFASNEHQNEAQKRYFRVTYFPKAFSCNGADSDIDYHLVVIPRERMRDGVPEGLDKKYIAEHLHLTRKHLRR